MRGGSAPSSPLSGRANATRLPLRAQTCLQSANGYAYQDPGRVNTSKLQF